MGLFSSLKNAILSKISEPKRPTVQKTTPPSPPSKSQEPPASSEGLPPSRPSEPEPPQRLTAAELEGQLDKLAAESNEKLDWKHSIVDLMKLVGMDSSLAERKEMALDLGYSQKDIDSKGSAEMNIWLHKKVLEKLSEDTDGDLKIA